MYEEFQMKTGKVSQAILDRSVLRPLSGAGVLTKKGAAFGEDCGFVVYTQETGSEEGWPVKSLPSDAVNTDQEMAYASVCGTVGGVQDRTVEMLIGSVMNNLSTAGARTEYLTMNVLFPAAGEEKELKELAVRTGRWCRDHGMILVAGHTEVSDAVQRAVVSLTGWGHAAEKEGKMTVGLLPDQDLVMTGWIGMAGTAILAKNREEELARRYPFSIIEGGKGLGEQILVQEAVREAAAFEVSAMHDVSQGGIFAALWEMAECAGVGLEVDLKRIPVRQETVEICEFFNRNPYQLYGQGALLLGTPRGEALVEHFHAVGIPAAVIGQTTSGNDRIIRNGEDVRFLDRPAQDELWVKNKSVLRT